MSRLDILRSLVRDAADAVGDRLRDVEAIAGLRKGFEDLRARRVRIGEETLTAAVAQAHGAESASVIARDGSIRCEVAFSDGDRLAVTFVPEGVRFAPRGAKEVAFDGQPAEVCRGNHVTDVAAALGTAIAIALWGPAAPRGEEAHRGAIADRQGTHFRIDLRSLPWVRALGNQGPTAMLLDLLEPTEMRVEDGALVLALKLPLLGHR